MVAGAGRVKGGGGGDVVIPRTLSLLTPDIRGKLCQLQALTGVVRQRDTASLPYDLYYAFSLLDELSRNKESGWSQDKLDILKEVVWQKKNEILGR